MPTVHTSFKTNGRMYAAGTDVPKSDPVCKTHSAFLDDDSPVEQATAGPGEKRSTRRPAKKKAAAKKPAAKD